jgi:hypothetical protein
MKGKYTDIVYSIGFYQREQWPLLLETADDRHVLEDTYDQWLFAVKKNLKKMRAAGMEPLRVDVDVNELLAWCKTKGVKNIGTERAAYFADLCRLGRGKKIDIK